MAKKLKAKSKSGIRGFNSGNSKRLSRTESAVARWDGGFIKVDTGESPAEKTARFAKLMKRKLGKKTKYLAIDNSRPYVTARDGELDDAKVVTKTSMPDTLKGKISEEEFIEIAANDLDSCEVIYHDLCKVLNHPIEQMENRMVKEGEKYLPYIAEPEKFKDVVDMTYENVRSLKRELDSIRKLYIKHLDENGRVKASADKLRGTAYMIELVLDIKLCYTVVGNRIKKAVGLLTAYLSDFYTQSVITYYLINKEEEPPEDIKKFIENDLHRYLPKEYPGNETETTPEEKVGE